MCDQYGQHRKRLLKIFPPIYTVLRWHLFRTLYNRPLYVLLTSFNTKEKKKTTKEVQEQQHNAIFMLTLNKILYFLIYCYEITVINMVCLVVVVVFIISISCTEQSSRHPPD